MYSLDVNFLKDRAGYQNNTSKKGQGIKLPTGDFTPVYVGLAIGLCLPTFFGGGLWLLQARTGQLDQEIAQLDQENQKLEAEIGNINKIREQTKQVQAETQGLVTVFDQIRPWSAMLQDLRDRIPATVQIETVRQLETTASAQGQSANSRAGGLEITGLARSFNDVNDFLLTLQESKFLQSATSRITSATLVDAPLPPGSNGAANSEPIKLPQVVQYTIQSSISDVPASELIRELEKKGTVGLVTRIRSIQEIGVISK
ncbi:PilN domain-containing protein [Nodularia sp. UHCC 0506]|uniref:PilN domain-containing protein n=1 Tax=Nodularia sp. UHCC 0506 TaxID=3110243 RepID=UPI002B20DC3D|nr:PilN domain-containing protein [Nodularia sp. UHCC 0506]MEA5512700.1 PilN domain-containing protein [Nodularia sp. UHCC 0506]